MTEARPTGGASAPAVKRGPPDPGRQSSRPCGRAPAGQGPHQAAHRVRGHGLLVVAVGLLGLRVLGQSNDRVATLGALQERAFAYGKLQSDACTCSPAPRREPADPTSTRRTPGSSRRSPARVTRIDRAVAECARAGRARDPRGQARLRASGRGRSAIFARSARRASSSRTVIASIIESSKRGASADAQKPLRNRAQQLAADLHQLAAVLANCNDGEDRRADRAERELVRELAESVHRRRRGGDRPRAAAGVRALLVGDRADPANRLAAGRDRVGRLLRTRRRLEPRRAGRARRQREPDERRARPSLQGARDDEPPQVGVPGEHVARASDAVELDHRLLAGAARADVRRA